MAISARLAIPALALVGLVATFAVACVADTSTTPSSRALVVHSILDLGSHDQYVIVQASAGTVSSQVPVSGAIVTMTLPSGQTVSAVEESNATIARSVGSEPVITRVYHFSLDRLGVVLIAGGTYQLRVTIPDGRVVTGRTTIPAAAPATVEQEPLSFDRAHDTLSANWPRVPAAAGYQVDISPGSGPSIYHTFADTAVMLPGTLSVFASLAKSDPDAPAHVLVSAMDSASYAYYRRVGDPLSGIGTTGNLTGALGVFGSIVEVKRVGLRVH